MPAGAGLMQSMGAQMSRTTALIGPGIQQPSYQVGLAMRDELLDSVDPQARQMAEQCFINDPSGEDGKLRFDLPGLAAGLLDARGVGHVHNFGLDTYGHPAAQPISDGGGDFSFFSHRRATHDGIKDVGRQIAVIALENDMKGA